MLISSSTWGALFLKARQVYQAVVRPSFTYASPIWAPLPSPIPLARPTTPNLNPTVLASSLLPKAKPKALLAIPSLSLNKLEKLQNKALRSITGAYKATPIRALESETFILPLPLYLYNRAYKYQERIASSNYEKEKNEALFWIQKRTRKRRPLQAFCPTLAPSIQPTLLEAWRKNWTIQPRDKWGITLPPSPYSLRLYKGLAKAESSIIVQLRTGRIGLAEFLHKRKVPDYPTPFCSCGLGVGSTSHFLKSCPLYSSSRPRVFKGKTKEDLLTDPLLAKTTARWAIQTGALQQFDLAKILLYDPP